MKTKAAFLLFPTVAAAAAITMSYAQAPAPAAPSAPAATRSVGTVPDGTGTTGSNRAVSTSTDNPSTTTPADMDTLFARLDANRDGILSRDEFRAGMAWLRANPVQTLPPDRPAGTGTFRSTYDTGAQSTGSATGSSNSGVKDGDKNGAPSPRRQ